MKRELIALVVGAALLGCEMVYALDKPVAQFSWHDEYLDDQHLRFVDSPHIHREILTMTIESTSRVAGAGGVHGQKVEGSLDIFWENYLKPTAAPSYRIHFLKYVDPRNGAQQSNTIVGTANLVAYLSEIGFAQEDVSHWLKQVSDKKSLSIPNVMLPMQYLAAYEPRL